MARPREWTAERIETLARELETWFLEDDTRMFYKGFYTPRRDLYPELISRLQSVNETFRQTIKRLDGVQEARLLDYALKRKVDVAMAIFLLKNKHGYADKIEQKVKSENKHVVSGSLDALTPEQLRDRIFMITERASKS